VRVLYPVVRCELVAMRGTNGVWYRWDLKLRCGCTVLRNARTFGDTVFLPPRKAKCETQVGCRNHCIRCAEGQGDTIT
jgi:hypothetical protein